MMIDKVLIVNRGEIALRIIRACKELGTKTVAIYSQADKGALHARMADEAYLVGPPPAKDSYLNVDKIIGIAKKSGARGIHPGYGFLAENPEFAERVQEEGLIFIGPRPNSMRLMGNKVQARDAVEKSGVPTIPGENEVIKDVNRAQAIAEEIGFPLLIKAAAGGGGKGMRIVENGNKFKNSFERAVSEVEKSFGDPSVYIEKYLPKVRHIEFQILADEKGNAIHLGERECSIQRRHQKLVEEAPSLKLDSAKRGKMGQAALKVARACEYTSAGTVEFLWDEKKETYYFLEMNTRLQVEHPVTEETCGLDIVKEQLKIASGQPLSISQDQVKMRGSAIEARIYAEDPEQGFLPSTGVITDLTLPSGPGIRMDCAIYPGERITRYYDPLLGKLIAWDKDRKSCIKRMRRALSELEIVGVKTTVNFHRRVMENQDFIEGNYFTDFIEHLELPKVLSPEEMNILAIGAAIKADQDTRPKRIRTGGDDDYSGWKAKRFEHQPG